MRLLRGLGIKSCRLFFGKIGRSRKDMEIYKWKWMVLGALGCMNNANFEKIIIITKKVNDNIVLDVFIICQKLRHVQMILKNTVIVRTNRSSK